MSHSSCWLEVWAAGVRMFLIVSAADNGAFRRQLTTSCCQKLARLGLVADRIQEVQATKFDDNFQEEHSFRQLLNDVWSLSTAAPGFCPNSGADRVKWADRILSPTGLNLSPGPPAHLLPIEQPQTSTSTHYTP